VVSLHTALALDGVIPGLKLSKNGYRQLGNVLLISTWTSFFLKYKEKVSYKTICYQDQCYSKAASILRHVAKQPFMPPPSTNSEVSSLTVHSAKSSLISAAKQLDPLIYHYIGLLSRGTTVENRPEVTDIVGMIQFTNCDYKGQL